RARDIRRRQAIMGGLMGQIVYAAAMSHVLYPDYYGENVGPHGRKMVEELIEVVRDMGRTLAAAAPDALVVVADDHLNVFSFDAVPALCVRVGRSVSRMVQDDAIEFDRALDGLPEAYPVHADPATAALGPPRRHADGSGRPRGTGSADGQGAADTGSHELLNWLVLLGAVSPARARVRFFGEMGRIDLAALEWDVADPQGGHE